MEIMLNGRGVPVRVIRSSRRTIGVTVDAEGNITVRAPMRCAEKTILTFLQTKEPWLAKYVQQGLAAKEKLSQLPKLTRGELEALAERACKVIPERVRHYAALLGVTYGKITIRNQKTKWGSCSGKGNLNFNCLLMLAPPEVLDSVVVHELCHRRHMDHSRAFYEEIYRVFPDYDRHHRWLKENGAMLLGRMAG